MKLVDEFRHLDGLKGGGIAVSETEYMATTILHEAEPFSQVIYSSLPSYSMMMDMTVLNSYVILFIQ